mgnify:CR=1 FL=1
MIEKNKQTNITEEAAMQGVPSSYSSQVLMVSRSQNSDDDCQMQKAEKEDFDD